MRRPALIALLAAAAALAAGCGSKSNYTLQGADEGSYLDAGPLLYQVQLSRYLNPADQEDQQYLKGVPSGTAQPTKDETWFGVFMRVQNFTKQTHTPTTDFTIEDTQHNVYRPLTLDSRLNPFAYQPFPLSPGAILPEPESTAANGPIQGELLLFKIKIDSTQNRPLDLVINGGGRPARVSLDL